MRILEKCYLLILSIGPNYFKCISTFTKGKNIEELLKENSIILSIDLKPALDIEKLDIRILRDFEELKK